MTISEERQLGRAKNAALAFFERRISVPKIYIDALWAGISIDLLAIDRDGVGDVHAVLLFNRPYHEDGRLNLAEQDRLVIDLIERFSTIPANYKYVAAVDVDHGHWIALFKLESMTERLFSSDGIGRIGLLHITAASDEEPETRYVLRGERFRAVIAKLADAYVQQHEADWEIRA